MGHAADRRAQHRSGSERDGFWVHATGTRVAIAVKRRGKSDSPRPARRGCGDDTCEDAKHSQKL